jgi:hypothetical protein
MKVTAFEADRDHYSQGLAALIERHAETFERVTHLQADVQERLIPALNRLTAGLKSSDVSWLKPMADRNARGDRKPATSQAAARPMTGPTGNSENRVPSSRLSGEVTVRHVSSFRQAAQLMRAIAELKGVEMTRLRAYANGEATFDVTVDHGTLGALEVRNVDGCSIDVIEATASRLVLQIERRQQPFPPG